MSKQRSGTRASLRFGFLKTPMRTVQNNWLWIFLGIVAIVVIIMVVWAFRAPAPTLSSSASSDASDTSLFSPMLKTIDTTVLDAYTTDPVVHMQTDKGEIVVRLYKDDAPQTVANFLNLINDRFYDGLTFHRVIDDFMIQTGDPLSKDDDPSDDGTGGPGYQFDDEFNNQTPKLVRGVVAMANAGPNTNGSQFFIITAEAADWLDEQHTPFAQVVEGMEAVDKIGKIETDDTDRPIKDIIVEKITLSAD